MLSIKSECLNKMIFFGEALASAAPVSEFVEHYHGERAHQGLISQSIENLEPTSGLAPPTC